MPAPASILDRVTSSEAPDPDPPVAFTVRLSAEDVAVYEAVADAARTSAELEQHLQTSPVDLTDLDAVRTHLIGAHWMHEHHLYRDGTNENDPRMDPIDWELANRTASMPAMTLRDLLVLHEDDHAQDPSESQAASTLHWHASN